MKKNLYLLLLLVVPAFVIVSCNDDDDPEPVNEEEVITNLTMTFTEVGGSDVVVLEFNDPDGEGGDDPTITADAFKANTTYEGSITVGGPDEDITEEIEEEDEEHQFFFEITSANLEITYADEDPNGNPIGLEIDSDAGDASSGALKVTLRHEPDKNASGVSDGDISNAGGETDIEVTFSITIE